MVGITNFRVIAAAEDAKEDTSSDSQILPVGEGKRGLVDSRDIGTDAPLGVAGTGACESGSP